MSATGACGPQSRTPLFFQACELFCGPILAKVVAHLWKSENTAWERTGTMSKSYEIHVISNTHWDREWVCNFQETRMMLVDFFDGLLDILDNEPRYHSYLLDSQAVPVEDYLEVRPEKRECIARHVASRRLFVGPWYTCPEEFCVNGESLVRNLVYGHRVAREFGNVMKVGHTPFSYGQNSQMPQIYAGFGIDTILFYHGVSHDDTPNEFIFEGADGTRLLASQMSSEARYNFYHNAYRRVLYAGLPKVRVYSWTQGGLPFHLCSEGRCTEHHFLLDPPKHFYKKSIEECFRNLRNAEINTATTRYLAFMDGHDSSVADTATLRIIDEMQKYVGKDRLFHSSLPDLMEKVKSAARDLPVLRGERRVPRPIGGRIHLFSDVLSSRTRMKRLNAQAEFALQRCAEPFATMAWRLGREYPAALLDMAWKTLLKCHAHDSIAGAGVDEIERDMTYRLRQVINISQGLTARSLQHIQMDIDNSDVAKDDVLITVFNPSPYARSEVLTAVVDFPRESGYGEFSLVDSKQRRAGPIQVVSRRPYHSVVNHPGDAAAMMASERVRFHFEAKAPAFGYATYLLVREPNTSRKGLVCGHNAMQNEHLWVGVNPDGTLCVLHKETGAEFDGLHYFEDGGEAGNAWMHVEPAHDSIVSSQGSPVRISLEENGPLLARYKIERRLEIPIDMEENGGDAWQRLDGCENAARRTDETRELKIRSWVTLRKGARAVEVRTEFDNVCRNHRLRVLFPSGIDTKTCDVESAFDVVEREVVYGPGHPWAQAINPTFPMQRFVDVSDGKVGLAIINDGLREYEVTSDPERTIAVTLARAFELALATVCDAWERHPEMGLSQSPGAHEFRYLIYPHAGAWDEAEVYREAERLSAPLELAQAGPHKGGMPKRCSFLRIEPANLVLSALKQSEDGEAMIARVFNPTAKPLEGTLKFFHRVAAAEIVTLEEEPVETLQTQGKSIRLHIGAKKILTVKLRFS